MKQILQVVVNGHVIRVEADEGTHIHQFKATALMTAKYENDPDMWRLLNQSGALVEATVVRDIPSLTYLSLPAGVGA